MLGFIFSTGQSAMNLLFKTEGCGEVQLIQLYVIKFARFLHKVVIDGIIFLPNKTWLHDFVQVTIFTLFYFFKGHNSYNSWNIKAFTLDRDLDI